MNTSAQHADFHPRDVCRLASRALDGAGTDEELVHLEQLLTASASAREVYYRVIDLHAELAWALADKGSESGVKETGSPLLYATPDVAPPAVREVEGSSTHPVSYLPRRSLALSPVTWSILAASLLFAAYFVVISWNMLGRERSDRLAEMQSPLSLEGRGVGGEGVAVATITASEDANWSPHVGKSLRDLHSASRRDATTRAAITPGEPLSLSSGLVELKLNQGTTLTIEGPAEWTIDGDNNATLNRGKLVAKVPQQAVGFTLETPTATIVDLGTEFGIHVDGTGGTQIAVLTGVLECAIPKLSQLPTRLRTGETMRISGDGKVTPLACDPGEFAALAAKFSDQPSLKNDAALWVYEPFAETRDGGTLHHRHDGFGFRLIEWVASEAVGGDGLPIFCVRSDDNEGARYFPRNVTFKGTPGVFEHRATEWGLTRATRKMARPVHLAEDGEYFLSFVAFKYRVNSHGMVGFFSREAGEGIEAGWNYSGNSDADPFAIAVPGQLKKADDSESRIAGDANPVFFVVRIVASAEKPDAVCLKTYRSTDTVHESPESLVGEGPGPDQWSVVLPRFHSDLVLDQLTLAVDGPNAYTHIDEIRLGTTWQAVTGVLND